jgi:small conductance mechanosensitive channel
VISGLFLLLEGQFAVGDYVTASGLSGRVLSIGLRVTALQDGDGQLHYVPNGGITTVTVRDEPWLAMLVDLTVAAKDAETAVAAAGRVADDTARQYEQWMRLDGAATVIGGDEWAVVRVPVQVFLGREWLAKEELPARLKAAMTTMEIAMPPDRLPQAYITATKSANGLVDMAGAEAQQ